LISMLTELSSTQSNTRNMDFAVQEGGVINFAYRYKDKVDPKLKHRLASVLEASEKRESETVRFFVPLGGKSADLKFLYDCGFEVIGCNEDGKTCQHFLEENKLDFKRSGGNPMKEILLKKRLNWT
jgi:hypothetical protein